MQEDMASYRRRTMGKDDPNILFPNTENVLLCHFWGFFRFVAMDVRCGSTRNVIKFAAATSRSVCNVFSVYFEI